MFLSNAVPKAIYVTTDPLKIIYRSMVYAAKYYHVINILYYSNVVEQE